MRCEMQLVALDPDTADRMLSGTIAPADAPPGHGDLVRLLDAAARGEAIAEDVPTA